MPSYLSSSSSSFLHVLYTYVPAVTYVRELLLLHAYTYVREDILDMQWVCKQTQAPACTTTTAIYTRTHTRT